MKARLHCRLIKLAVGGGAGPFGKTALQQVAQQAVGMIS